MLDIDAEDVPSSTFSPYEPRSVGIGLDLSAQTQDQHVDRAVEDFCIVGSCALEQLITAQDAMGRLHEGLEQ